MDKRGCTETNTRPEADGVSDAEGGKVLDQGVQAAVSDADGGKVLGQGVQVVVGRGGVRRRGSVAALSVQTFLDAPSPRRWIAW